MNRTLRHTHEFQDLLSNIPLNIPLPPRSDLLPLPSQPPSTLPLYTPLPSPFTSPPPPPPPPAPLSSPLPPSPPLPPYIQCTLCLMFSQAVAGGTLSTTLILEHRWLLTRNEVKWRPTNPTPEQRKRRRQGIP